VLQTRALPVSYGPISIKRSASVSLQSIKKFRAFIVRMSDGMASYAKKNAFLKFAFHY